MFKALRARKSTSRPSRVRSSEYHEEQYRIMRSTRLADGCSSQDFADKCNMLVSDHLPYFQTVKLEGADLIDAFIAFLPEALAGDGRDIKDRLEDDNKANDTELALERLTRRVARAADPAVENARLAMSMAPAGISPPSPQLHTLQDPAPPLQPPPPLKPQWPSLHQPAAAAAGAARATPASASRKQVQKWVTEALAAVEARRARDKGGKKGWQRWQG